MKITEPNDPGTVGLLKGFEILVIYLPWVRDLPGKFHGHNQEFVPHPIAHASDKSVIGHYCGQIFYIDYLKIFSLN